MHSKNNSLIAAVISVGTLLWEMVVGAGEKTEKRQTVALAELTVQRQPGPAVNARLVRAREAVCEDLHWTSSRGRKHTYLR
eukprot:15366373-Ditylum_brightwellii.AAC.1